MNQSEKRLYLIHYLLNERGEKNFHVPSNTFEQKRLLRSLFNIRMPAEYTDEFIQIQDDYLREENQKKGITDIAELTPIQDNLYIWQGDITTLKCDAIVNAANSQMLGCFCPCHGCIDNAIHTFAGIQLRNACAEIMRKQGYNEPTGKAKITPAFNLPCQYIIHTVGPIIQNTLSQKDCDLLESCYRSCLELASANNLQSIAFCCISTGEFHFPNAKAAKIAVATVQKFLKNDTTINKVIFNVFKDIDLEIYHSILNK